MLKQKMWRVLMMIIIIMMTTTTTWDQNVTETGSCRAEFNPTSCLHCCGFLCFSDWTILKWLTLSVSRSFSVLNGTTSHEEAPVSRFWDSKELYRHGLWQNSVFIIFTRVFHCYLNSTYFWTYNLQQGHMLNSWVSICFIPLPVLSLQAAASLQRTRSIYNGKHKMIDQRVGD